MVVVVPAGLLVLGAGAASAQGTDLTVHAEPSAVTFGLLGPVGLVAVALGIVGMTAGVLRQRRKVRAAVVPAEATTPNIVAIADSVLSEEPTRPALTPAQRLP
jgi:hypothetical protein